MCKWIWIWISVLSLYYGSKGGGLVALVPTKWLSTDRHRASPALKVGNLQLQSPSARVKGGNGSQHPYRGSPETSSHPGLAASVHKDARKLCCELCFSGDIERSQSTHSFFCCLHAAASTSRTSKSVWGSSYRVILCGENQRLVEMSYLVGRKWMALYCLQFSARTCAITYFIWCCYCSLTWISLRLQQSFHHSS